jgi:protein-tyrosine phosphatase
VTRILFVCMGNICRSPVAEGVMRHLLDGAGLGGEVDVDSAGTGAWHVGEPPDPRAVAAAARRGIRLGGAARQVDADDFHRHDLLLCADGTNVRELLLRLPADGGSIRKKVRRLREFDPSARALGHVYIPDPYHGADPLFDTVLDQCFAACGGVLEHVRLSMTDRV